MIKDNKVFETDPFFSFQFVNDSNRFLEISSTPLGIVGKERVKSSLSCFRFESHISILILFLATYSFDPFVQSSSDVYLHMPFVFSQIHQLDVSEFATHILIHQ